MNWLREIYYYILAQEFRYQMVAVLVLLLLVLSLVMVIIVLRERTQKSFVESRKNRLKKRVEPIIQEIIFDTENTDLKSAINRLKRSMSAGRKSADSDIIRELVLYYHRNLDGDAKKRLQELYRETDLKDQDLNRMKSGEWHEQARSITNLGEMRMRETLFEILQYADQPNELVRNEAQYVAVVLGGKRALGFLDEISSPISEWQQIRLLDECMNFQYQLLEKITDWLRSSNHSVVLFGLKVVRNTNQYQGKSEIKKLLYHKNTKIQESAVETCIHLGYNSLLPELLETYELSKNQKHQEAILKAIGELGTFEHAAFLKDVIKVEKRYEIILEASRALKKLGKRDILLSMSQNGIAARNKAIINHILDDRI